MPLTKGHKPVRKWSALEAVKHFKSSRKGTGKIDSTAQFKYILANVNHAETAERSMGLIWFFWLVSTALDNVSSECGKFKQDLLLILLASK
jgi:hypothetical protein